MIKFAALDWVLLTVVLLFAVKGGWRGFVRESLGYVAIILGVVGLLAFGDMVAALAIKRFGWSAVPTRIGAYIVCFLLPYLSIMIVAFLVKRFLKAIELGGVDRTAGVVFGALVGAVFAGALLIAAERVGLGTDYMAEATLAPTLKDLFNKALVAADVAWNEIVKARG